jgi:hypothetical protein
MMNFQSLWFLKGSWKLRIQTNLQQFSSIFLKWKFKAIYFGMQWINMRKKKSIILERFKGKGQKILFDQF